jgi:hypothetical protein
MGDRFDYLELLRASDVKLQFKGGLTSGRRLVKIIAESLSQHDEKHVILTPLSGIRVGKRFFTPILVAILVVSVLYSSRFAYFGHRRRCVKFSRTLIDI